MEVKKSIQEKIIQIDLNRNLRTGELTEFYWAQADYDDRIEERMFEVEA